MFRQLKVPILGMIENMSFFDVQAYLRDRGGPKARHLLESQDLFEAPGDERAYLFGRGGARRKAEQLGVPFLGEVPLTINVRESGDLGRLGDALAPGSPSRPYLLGVVEQLAAQISIQNIKTPKMPKLEILN
jgi:ATP-binding protein involved in chromosome partitioning